MATKYLRIHYGPCYSHSQPRLIAEHKPQILTGLRQRLREMNYRVDLNPVEYINYCMVEMCGHVVFQCNLLSLKFNTQWRHDKVCQRAVEDIIDATTKFLRCRDYMWAMTFVDDGIFNSKDFALADNANAGDFAAPNFLPELKDEDLKPFELKCPDNCSCANTKEPVSRESTWSYEGGAGEEELEETDYITLESETTSEN